MRGKLAGEPYDEAALDVQLRDGVADIVRKQADIGIDVVDDGEFSKSHFISYLVGRLTGFEKRPDPKGDESRSLGMDRQTFGQFHVDTVPPSGLYRQVA